MNPFKITFTLIVSFVFILLIYPFLVPVSMGALFAVLFYPMNQRLRKFIPISAFLITAISTLLLIIPIFLCGIFGAKFTFLEFNRLKETFYLNPNLLDSIIQSSKVQNAIYWITKNLPFKPVDITDTLFDVLRITGTKAAETLGNLLTQLPSILLWILISTVSFYFCLSDGKKLLAFIEKKSAFSPRETKMIFKTVSQMCRSVILAACISGLIQAILEMTLCTFCGIDHLFIIFVSIFFGSFIPIIGAMPVVAIIVIYSLFYTELHQTLLLVISGFFLFGIDSIIRPWFLKESSNLHPLIAFLSAVGGLSLIGFFGVFLGPILAGLFIQVIDILTQDT